MKRFRIQLLIAFIVLICGVSLMGLVYIFFNKPDTYIAPGVTSVSAPNPVAIPWQNSRTSARVSNYPVHLPSYGQPYHHTNSSIPMQPMRGIYTTSSAQVHSVGGGNGGYMIATTSNSSSSTRGIAYSSVNVSATMPSSSFTAMASKRQVAQPEASEAPQMARLAASPRTISGPPNPGGGGGGGLDEEHQLIEQPIGDGMIVLLLLIMGYSLFLLRKRKEA